SVVVAGVLLGRSGHRLTDAHIRLQLHAVSAVVVFLLESVVFSIVGLELPTLVRDLPAGTGWWPLQALALAAVLIAVRVLSTLPLTRAVEPGRGRPGLSWRVAGVVTWAGTRGVMPLAAALSVPLLADDGSALPGRPLVLVLTTAVVVLTLVVQGLTLAAVVHRSGLALEPEHTAREEDEARDALNRAALDHVEYLTELEAVPDTALDRVRRGLTARLDRSTETPDGTTADTAYRQLRREVIAVQSTALHRLYDEHRISDTTRRRLQHDLDREEAALGSP
ncbi:Na+/H+ antiporter, partial [Kitasatospora sp. NPDC004799]